MDIPKLNINPALLRSLLGIGGEFTINKPFDLSSILTKAGIDFGLDRLQNFRTQNVLDILEINPNYEGLVLKSADYHLCEAFNDPAFKASSSSLIFCSRGLGKIMDIMSSYKFEKAFAQNIIQELVPLTTDLMCTFIIDSLKSTCSEICKKNLETHSLTTYIYDSLLSKTIKLYYYVLDQQNSTRKVEIMLNQPTILVVVIDFWEDFVENCSSLNVTDKLRKMMNETLLFSFIGTSLPQSYCLKILKVYNKINGWNKQQQEERNLEKIVERLICKNDALLNRWIRHNLYGSRKTNEMGLLERCAPDDLCFHVDVATNPTSNEFEHGIELIKSFFTHQFKDLKDSSFIIDIYVTLGQIGYIFFSTHRNKYSIHSYLEFVMQLVQNNSVGTQMLCNEMFKWILVAKNSIIFDINTKGHLKQVFVENICVVLMKLSALTLTSDAQVTAQSYYDDCFRTLNDIYEINNCMDDEEITTTQEESDDEIVLNNVCTFVSTQRDFINQHWYYCYTCKMSDGIGVCSVCAQLCHKNHDVSYAKYGNFFCDCGAKEDGSCMALNKWTTGVPGQFSLLKNTPHSLKKLNKHVSLNFFLFRILCKAVLNSAI